MNNTFVIANSHVIQLQFTAHITHIFPRIGHKRRPVYHRNASFNPNTHHRCCNMTLIRKFIEMLSCRNSVTARRPGPSVPPFLLSVAYLCHPHSLRYTYLTTLCRCSCSAGLGCALRRRCVGTTHSRSLPPRRLVLATPGVKRANVTVVSTYRIYRSIYSPSFVLGLLSIHCSASFPSTKQTQISTVKSKYLPIAWLCGTKVILSAGLRCI